MTDYGALSGATTAHDRVYHDETHPHDSEQARPSWFGARRLRTAASVVVLLAGGAAAVAALAHYPSAHDSTMMSASALAVRAAHGSGGGLRIVVSGEYDAISHGDLVWAQKAYPFLRDEAHLVEPHRVTTLELAGMADDSAAVAWTIEESSAGSDGDGHVSSSGARQLHHVFTGLQRYDVTACVANTGASSVSPCVTKPLVCRYVRREIRALTPADRATVFDTMATLVEVDTAAGQKKYGSTGYRDYAHFVRQHLVQTSSRRGDELHDGMGFLTAHVAQGNVFERALQAVNPAVALPYWDYTIEAASVATLVSEEPGFETVRELWGTKVSPLWTNEWFGAFPVYNVTTENAALAVAEARTAGASSAASAGGRATSEFPSGNVDLDNSAQTVTEGRWAYMRIPTAASADDMQSPWGYLRSPWNFNRMPYLTRGHDLCGESSLGAGAESSLGLVDEIFPSCATHLDAATSSAYSNWRSFAWTLQYKPHGHVHTTIGGTHNCADAYGQLEGLLTAHDLTELRYASFTSLRNLWRRMPGTVELPSLCSNDAVDACKPSCDMAAVKSNAALREAMWEAVYDWKSVNVTQEGLNASSPLESKGQGNGDYSAEVKTKVLAVICDTAIGMGDHTAASSPFDPSFHFMHSTLERLYQLRALTGGFSGSMAWSNEGTCIWGECVGHRANDTLYEAVYAYSDEAGGFAPMAALAHHELRELMNPTGDRMPYVYEHFSMPHCDSQGVAFPGLSNFTANERR